MKFLKKISTNFLQMIFHKYLLQKIIKTKLSNRCFFSSAINPTYILRKYQLLVSQYIFSSSNYFLREIKIVRK